MATHARVILLLAALGIVATAAHADDAAGLISPDKLATQLQSHVAVTIIDVRTPEEYAAGHLPGALNIPYDEVEKRVGELKAGRDKPVVVYCRTGRRSRMAGDTLKSLGFTAVLHLEGDLPGWQERGFAVEPPQEPPPAPR